MNALEFLDEFFAMTGADWRYWLALILALLWWQS